MKKPVLGFFLVYVLCLAGASFNHARDILEVGWLPYQKAPFAINAYWTALTFFDPLALGLLFWRLRLGLILTLVIITSDVAINSVMAYGSKYVSESNLQLQTAFLGFVIGSFPLLWQETGHTWQSMPSNDRTVK